MTVEILGGSGRGQIELKEDWNRKTDWIRRSLE